MSDENRIMGEKMDILIKLTAANVIQNKDFKEQVRLLSSVGLQPKEIADILGKTPNNVRVTLSFIRKEKNKKKGESQEIRVETNEQQPNE
jgi:DNA-directed RNA polymerase specialized sigma24 family protein